MNKIPFIAAGALMSAAAMTASGSENPFLKPYSTPYSIPPFESIEYQHYLPALQEGITQQRAELDAIINNPKAPTFENTILALDNSGELRTKVELVFGALSESNSSPEMIEIAETFMPLSVAFDDELTMNQALFERVKTVYDSRAALEPDQQRLTDQYYKRFVRNGALLDAEKKEELKKINSALADAYLLFNKNLLSATNAFEIVVTDPAELSGLPVSSVNLAADVAKSKGLPEGNWIFTLHAPSRLPVLQYADSRKLRKQIYEAYTSLATAAPYDNNQVIKDILKLRARKAELLGYRNYAAYQTEKVMAKTPEAATELLMQIWNPAKAKVAEEVAEMQAVADENGDGITIEPYDYYYYAEKVRQKKYNLDEAVVREYFPIDSVRKGIFNMAERLYGVKFTEMPDAPKYYPEVTVYNVTDATTGEHIAVFMTDYFSRPSKRQGAWMSEFKGSWQNPDGTWDRPIIYNVGNFTPAAGDAPSLLTLDEVETMFHEFGHGLHGMLTRVRYKGQAGTNVDRDFVELPSQIHEHWAMEPELLKVYARHYKTGETIPDALIERLQAAATHNQGFATAELSGAALIDLEFGTLTPDMLDDSFSVSDFVKAYDAKIGMPAQLTYRYRPTYFKHAFGSDEYSCGYYTYLWAEVLDTDGFELFRERGIFDPETAASFKHNILERGGSEDPMELYIRFRGAKPGVEPLLRNRGLEK
ncbi:MAG: M3 family metallopeptidase [Muribaculaceae bacterium]|nr:M3 family metallopeptidase [Muribaculaceae bacterium]